MYCTVTDNSADCSILINNLLIKLGHNDRNAKVQGAPVELISVHIASRLCEISLTEAPLSIINLKGTSLKDGSRIASLKAISDMNTVGIVIIEAMGCTIFKKFNS